MTWARNARESSAVVLHVTFVAGTGIVLAKVSYVENVLVILPIIVAIGPVGPLLLFNGPRRMNPDHASGLG